MYTFETPLKRMGPIMAEDAYPGKGTNVLLWRHLRLSPLQEAFAGSYDVAASMALCIYRLCGI